MKKMFIAIMVAAVLVFGFGNIWNRTAYRDVNLLKIKAPIFIQERGFRITSYDGFEGSICHGGYVWYQVRDSSNYLYNLAVGDWKGELMIYNTKCLNAVTNN
jgi:hypothetical protein